MPIRPNPSDQAGDLRLLAHARLGRDRCMSDVSGGAAAALGVLLGMASTPATAANALAVLHELQVHQVELGLQAEELQSAVRELEQALARQRQLFDHAPVAQFTVDGQLRVVEANLTAARWMGRRIEDGPENRLGRFLDTSSTDSLNRSLKSVHLAPAFAVLTSEDLVWTAGSRRAVHASLARDRVDGQYIVVLMDTHRRPALAA
jgi:PAS domain-containing protein